MIEETEIRIGDLIKISRKGDDMTIREKKELNENISLFREIKTYQVGNREVSLTPTQKEFVSKLLKTYILEDINLSEIEKILAVYDFNLDTVLIYNEDCSISQF